MTTAMQVKGGYSFPSYVWRQVCLGRGTMLTYWCIQFGLWLLVSVVMLIAEQMFGSEGVALGIPGIAAFIGGILVVFCMSVTLTGVYFALAVNLGVSRRRVVAGIWVLGALYGAAIMLATVLLQMLWAAVFAGGRPVLDMISLIPWWGWASAALLPVAFSVFGSGIVRTFGTRGGVVLYIAFMAFCIVPSQMNNIIPLEEEQLLAALPWFFAVLGVVCGVVGTILLLRVNIKNG